MFMICSWYVHIFRTWRVRVGQWLTSSAFSGKDRCLQGGASFFFFFTHYSYLISINPRFDLVINPTQGEAPERLALTNVDKKIAKLGKLHDLHWSTWFMEDITWYNMIIITTVHGHGFINRHWWGQGPQGADVERESQGSTQASEMHAAWLKKWGNFSHQVLQSINDRVLHLYYGM